MVETILSRSMRVMFSGGVALSIGMLAQPVFAQDTTTAAPVQRVEITGSSIRRVDAETPSPVQVITADELKKSGFTSVADVLSNITANGQGTLSNGFSGAFAAGATAVSLRGLNSSATLVLIDGHRMASNALSDDGQRSFVDTSNLPFDAIERIEILKDGASAVYGSDAMAGVINFILKKNFTGTTVSAEGGTSQAGGGTTFHSSIISGFGDLEADGYNVYGSLEARSTSPVTAASRAGESPNGGWTTKDWTGFGGNTFISGIVNPGLGIGLPSVHGIYFINPAYSGSLNSAGAASNLAFVGNGQCSSLALAQSGGCAYNAPGELSPKTENLNALVSFTKRLADGWQLNVKGSFFNSQTQVSPSNTSYPSGFGQQVALSASNPVPTVVGTVIPLITVPSNYPGNTLGVPAFIGGLSPNERSQTDVNSRTYRVAADLTGSIGEWDISAAAGYSKNVIRQTIYGSMNVPNFNTAINRCATDTTGSCVPFSLVGPNSAADIASVYPTLHATDVSDLAYLEVHGSRAMLPLRGGDLTIATGASYIYRNMQSPAPAEVGAGLIGGNNAYVAGSQSNAALFAEVNAPVLKTLELGAAARFDHFDTAGGTNSGTGKLQFKYTPVSAFGIRGTYSTGFRAPNPAEAGNAGLSYLGIPYDFTLCPGGPSGNANGAAPVQGAAVGACGTQVFLQSAAKSLQPEKSTAATLGLILEPIKGWSSTVDLYQIKIKDQIVSGPADLANPARVAVNPSQYCYTGADNAGTAPCSTISGTQAALATTTGLAAYYPAYYINANSTTVKGVELETHYKFKLGDWGTLRTSLDWSHTASYILNAGGTAYQLAGTHGPMVIGGNTANPKDRAQASLEWVQGSWDITNTANWISSYTLTDPSSNVTACNQGIGVYGSPSWFAVSGSGTANFPTNYCTVGSFLTDNLTISYKYSKQLSIHFTTDNLFNRQPPTDLNTYGGTQYPYNPSMHQAGAIGRFFNAGLQYTF